MPPNRAQKSSSSSSHLRTVQRDALLEAILWAPIVVPNSCSYCEKRGFPCESSPSEPSRCSECVRNSQARCDAQGVSPAQLRKIASQYAKLESELEEVESELEEVESAMEAMAAKAQRLRRQKRMWYEKMSRAISRGIDSIEELERAEAAVPPSSVPGSLDAEVDSLFPPGAFDAAGFPALSAADWAAQGLDPALLDPTLLADPGSVGGTAGASPGSSGTREVPTS